MEKQNVEWQAHCQEEESRIEATLLEVKVEWIILREVKEFLIDLFTWNDFKVGDLKEYFVY